MNTEPRQYRVTAYVVSANGQNRPLDVLVTAFDAKDTITQLECEVRMASTIHPATHALVTDHLASVRIQPFYETSR